MDIEQNTGTNRHRVVLVCTPNEHNGFDNNRVTNDLDYAYLKLLQTRGAGPLRDRPTCVKWGIFQLLIFKTNLQILEELS